MEIKVPKTNRRGWELDQLELMSKTILKILRGKQSTRKELCNDIYRDITHLKNLL